MTKRRLGTFARTKCHADSMHADALGLAGNPPSPPRPSPVGRSRWPTSAVVLVALASVAGGFAAGRGVHPRGPALASVPVPVPATPAADPADPRASASSCVDAAAMEANANLVLQLQDTQRQLRSAEQRASMAESTAVAASSSAPATVVLARQEWSRMARDGMIRVLTPCNTPSATSHYAVRGQHRLNSYSHRGRSDPTARAEVAGLSPEESEALRTVYERSHARTWRAMQGVCEASEAFRDAVKEMGDAGSEADAVRSAICTNLLANASSDEGRRAIVDVAVRRAAAHPTLGKGPTDAERVLFAVTASMDDLFDETVKMFGREKALRIANSGVLCVDEDVFDVREPRGS